MKKSKVKNWLIKKLGGYTAAQWKSEKSLRDEVYNMAVEDVMKARQEAKNLMVERNAARAALEERTQILEDTINGFVDAAPEAYAEFQTVQLNIQHGGRFKRDIGSNPIRVRALSSDEIGTVMGLNKRGDILEDKS